MYFFNLGGKMVDQEDQKKYEQAKMRVQRLRGFYNNLIVFAVVMAILLVFNVWHEPHNMWSLWIGMIWGIVLIIQAFSLFTIRDTFLGDEWEKKTIDKMMNKDNKNKK
jgi:protein-S-isoprenylcysteine O-methyltransferase Ste14